MGADFDFSLNQEGQIQLFYIDKGTKKINVEIDYPTSE